MINRTSLFSIIFYALLILVSFYVPLQVYARQIERQLAQNNSSISNRHKSILIAYLIWYTPFLALLVVGSLATSFWVVALVLIIGVGWIWLGHSYVQTRKR